MHALPLGNRWRLRPIARLAVALILLTGSGVAHPPCLQAQSSTGEHAAGPSGSWEAAVYHTWQHLSDQRAAWQVYEVLVQRRHAQGAVILKGAHVRRFGMGDETIAVDVWQDLWPQAYMHASLDYAPSPALLPGQAASGELYQAIPGGWELAGSYEQRRYPEQAAHLVGAGLARYVGAWYLRTKTTATRLYGRFSIVQGLRARRFLSPPHEYVGVRIGGGRVAEVVDEGPVIETVRTYFVTVQFQKYLTPHLGISVSGSYSDDAFFVRRGLSLGVMTRW